jgi:hypothetical protein
VASLCWFGSEGTYAIAGFQFIIRPMSGIAILKLQRAGFTDRQVEALAEYHEAGAATKGDIADLDRKLDTTRTDLELAIEKVRREVDRVRHDLELKIQRARPRQSDGSSASPLPKSR